MYNASPAPQANHSKGISIKKAGAPPHPEMPRHFSVRMHPVRTGRPFPGRVPHATGKAAAYTGKARRIPRHPGFVVYFDNKRLLPSSYLDYGSKVPVIFSRQKTGMGNHAGTKSIPVD
ncbi:hypothetical protein A6M21_00840 [Desulfotomaculum copahuensis]|uniref:Uncharacterized protein n=1 Tax=Desulfotomaculum copahuensis TaxID=1838280 RepID=A0A1B7LBZ8_9FIRM|nr:hypothetical protein A6M21_00840 [Desulfotomaculum copahuensis]